MRPAIDRFEEKYIPEPNSGCWIWTGALVHNGYARLQINNKNKYAHRFAYEHFVGPIPDGKELDHLCRTRCCVNPDHLEAVTHQVNQFRSPLFYGNRTHCPQGHPYSVENTHINIVGARECRICSRAKGARHRKKKKAAA